MSEKRRAPIEVLERLAEAADQYFGPMFDPGPGTRGHTVHVPLAAYRVAVAPLRTRAEVDAEIADNVRASVSSARGMACDDCLCPEGDGDNSRAESIRALCREPTAPNSGPSSADTEEVPSPRPPVSPAGADYSGPKPYGMTNYAPVYTPEAASRGTLEAIAVALDGTWYEGLNCDHSVTRALMNYRAECSGPAGVAAAKESKDNAAAPEGAALKGECDACGAIAVLHRGPLRDGNSHKRLCLSCMHRVADALAPADRDCNCDQALHLERRIGDAVRAIRRSSTIPAGLLHELLGILEGEA